MSDHEQPGHARPASPDPWASLADELGIGPQEPAQPDARQDRPSTPVPPRPVTSREKPPRSERPRATDRGVGWDDLASSLGLEPDARAHRPSATPVPRDVPRPARPEASSDRVTSTREEHDRSADEARRGSVPPALTRGDRTPRRDDREDRGDRGPVGPAGQADQRLRDDRSREMGGPEFAAGVFDAPGRDRSDEDGDQPGEPGEKDAGERRPRRRRGRRGGRGRRPRDGERIEGGIRERSDHEPLRDDHPAGSAARIASPDEVLDTASPTESFDRSERADDDAPGAPRRRRRGRRGGRGRSRGGRSGGEARPADAPVDGTVDAHPRRDANGTDEADEPLPGGYGVRPPAGRTEGDERGGRASADRAGDRDSDSARGDRSRRRGRRRRSGEAGARSGAGEASPSGEASRRSSRSRRERHPTGETRGETRSDAGFSRRRRSDFAPVGSGHDEDDEGLEFLGLDESGTARRDARPAADDDILVESGLASVQDVPSWVEAIGIVIAGNLDARSRSTRGDEGRRGGR